MRTAVGHMAEFQAGNVGRGPPIRMFMLMKVPLYPMSISLYQYSAVRQQQLVKTVNVLGPIMATYTQLQQVS